MQRHGSWSSTQHGTSISQRTVGIRKTAHRATRQTRTSSGHERGTRDGAVRDRGGLRCTTMSTARRGNERATGDERRVAVGHESRSAAGAESNVADESGVDMLVDALPLRMQLGRQRRAIGETRGRGAADFGVCTGLCSSSLHTHTALLLDLGSITLGPSRLNLGQQPSWSLPSLKALAESAQACPRATAGSPHAPPRVISSQLVHDSTGDGRLARSLARSPARHRSCCDASREPPAGRPCWPGLRFAHLRGPRGPADPPEAPERGEQQFERIERLYSGPVAGAGQPVALRCVDWPHGEE